MKKALLHIFVVFLCGVYAQQTINHYALAKVSNPAIAKKITDRFKATGAPVFLIHNFKRGLSEGDFIQFRDKLVLVDQQVWQTLKSDKALASLEAIPVIEASGLSSSNDWRTRATQMKSPSWEKAYNLGSEILKIFENEFSSPPKNEDVVIRFSNGRATLLVPEALLKSLKYKQVQVQTAQKKPTGAITWVSDSTERVFTGDTIRWQLWAVDPQAPSGNLRYELRGKKVPGLTWNTKTHSIEGLPTLEGEYPFSVTVTSEDNRSITQAGMLSVRTNTAPFWSNAPDTIRVGPSVIAFPVFLTDLHHAGENLKITFDTLPKGFRYSAENQVLTWHPQEPLLDQQINCIATVSDPLGKKRTHSVPISIRPKGENLGYLIGRLSPPWDTLTVGHTYRWNLTSEKQFWEINKLSFIIDSTSSVSSVLVQDSLLELRPEKNTPHTVTFVFTDRFGAKYKHHITMPVRPNRAPLFVSQPTDNEIDLYTNQYYVPVIYDPDDDAVALRLESSSTAFTLQNDTLIFKAPEPGTFSATVIAMDSYGNEVRQKVNYFSHTVSNKWRGFSIDWSSVPGYDDWGNTSYWRVMYEAPAIRVGIFSPDFMNLQNMGDTTEVGTQEIFQFPFLFIGRQLAPPAKIAQGTSAVVDIGFSYNVLSSEVQTIGFMLNTEIRAISKKWFSSELDLRFLLYGRHMFLQIPVSSTYDADDTTGVPLIDQQVGAHLLLEYIDPTNINMILHVTQWYHLGFGIFLGPTSEIRIAPLAQKYEIDPQSSSGGTVSWSIDRDQSSPIYLFMVGLGGRYHLKLDHFDMENKIRFGYGGERAGFTLFYDVAMRFGSWKK